jgi:hypothetical protein
MQLLAYSTREELQLRQVDGEPEQVEHVIEHAEQLLGL